MLLMLLLLTIDINLIDIHHLIHRFVLKPP